MKAERMFALKVVVYAAVSSGEILGAVSPQY
jgi:hypothetical protein